MPVAPLDALALAETPEGIALVLRPAGMVARSYAYSIDFLIRMAVILAATTVLGAMSRFGTGVFLLLLFGLEWGYPVAFELMPGAATPGKRALGLRVVMSSGLPVTPAAAMIRNLLRTADFLPFGYAIGLVLMLLRPDFKRLGDLAAGTLVIRIDHARLDGPLPDAKPIAPTRALTMREQAAVIAWAGRASRLTPERLEELATLAAPIIDSRGASRDASDEYSDRLLGVAQWLVGRR
jgi:uncharacterized RDD family membrane protein YckC